MTYLAKQNQTFGPFDDTQIQKMKDSGEFYSYEWMWDGVAPDWSPVPRKPSGPPMLPPEATRERVAPKEPEKEAPISSPAATAAASQGTASTAPVRSSKTFPSVLYDRRQSVGGEISQAHSRGGTFISSPGASSQFPKGANVFVDVLDEQQDKSVKVKATISTIARKETSWVFELDWPAFPLL